MTTASARTRSLRRSMLAALATLALVVASQLGLTFPTYAADGLRPVSRVPSAHERVYMDVIDTLGAPTGGSAQASR